MEITNYLVKLSQTNLTEQERKFIPDLIHCINDAERIGDHAKNLVELAQSMVDSKQQMTIEAKRDLLNYYAIVDKQFNVCMEALDSKNQKKAKEALALEDQINREFPVMSQNNVARLEKSLCTVPAGIVFIDMITNFEKIGDHLSNIAERIEPLRAN